MAVGNALVTTARFKPLSYQEWAAPLQALNAQHAATEEALWNLQDEASEYMQYFIDNPNSALTKRYNDFINGIDEASEILAREGINSQNRADLLALRREYSDIIKPIKTGLARYQKAVNNRVKDQSKGIIGRDLTPEMFMGDASYVDTYTTVDAISKDASKVFKSLKGYDNEPQIRILPDGSSVVEMSQSYSPEEYVKAFEGAEDAPQELVTAINTLRQKYAAYGYDEDTRKTIEDTLKYAAYSTIQNSKYSSRHYPPAPKAEKHEKTEEEKIKEGYGTSLTNTTLMGVENETHVNTQTGKKTTKKVIAPVYNPLAKKLISISAAQSEFPKEFETLRKEHKDFSAHPELFNIYAYSNGGKAKLAVVIKDEYKQNNNQKAQPTQKKENTKQEQKKDISKAIDEMIIK